MKPELNTAVYGSLSLQHHDRSVITRKRVSILVTKRGRDLNFLWKTLVNSFSTETGDHLCVPLDSYQETDKHLGYSS